MPENIINTPSLAEALVHSNHRFRKECMLIVMASVEEVTKHMRVINGLKGKETEATIVPQAKFRPYHSEKVISGTGGLTARTLETFPLEILEEFDPENLYTTIYGTPVDAEKITLDIVRRILTEEMNNASRGLCDLIFTGVRNADGIGALDGFDGFDTIITKERANGNISFEKGNFIPLGEVDETNIGDKWKLLYRRIHENLKGDSKKELVLICSVNEYEAYKNWFAAQYGAGNFAGTPEQTYLDGTANKVQIVPLPGMDGTHNCFITTEDNMKVGFDVMSKHTKFDVRVPDNPNVVQMHAKIYMGVDFANIEPEFLMCGSRTVSDSSIFMVTSADTIDFGDVATGESATKTIKLNGYNLTASSDIFVEGANASLFTVDANTVTADEANAEAGKEITITFTPDAAGEKSAKVRISNATDGVNMVVSLKANVTEA